MKKNNKRHFDSVVFDVDSTLVAIEGLDFLANLKHLGTLSEKLTKKAMDGEIPMNEVMEKKMQAIAPNLDDVEKMGEAYINNITPGVLETISFLKESGLKIWIVTGNFQPGVGILAKYLGIDESRVITNTIFFDDNNNYLGFDKDNPLSNNGGKAKIIKKYKSKMKRVAFVGDGSTDLETKNVVDLFIGFGGIVNRPKIQELSEVYVSDPNMKSIIQYIV